MIDPVTKLKITRRQWEAMGTTNKPREMPEPSEANYIYGPEEKLSAAPTTSAMFPPLPTTETNKRITQANKILKQHGRSNKPKRDS